MTSLIATLIGGGTMGALITAYFVYRRNKRQPVSYTKEIIHIFRKNKDFEDLNARFLVKDAPRENAPERSVDYLSLVRIAITNKGNQDIPEYEFGVTLKGTNKVVDMRMSTPDRSHNMTVGFEDAHDELFANTPDFKLVPFNRGEIYKVDIYFTYEEDPGEIEVSSSHPSKLVEAKDSDRALVILTNRWQLRLLGFGLALFIVAMVLNLATGLLASKDKLEKQQHDLQDENRMLKDMIEKVNRDRSAPSPTPSATVKKR